MGLWLSPPRRGRGCELPSPAGPTPTAITEIPPGRGKGLRTFPPRRGRGMWNPLTQRERGLRSLPPECLRTPLPLVGAGAPPQEWVGSGHTLTRRGTQPCNHQGHLHAFPMCPQDACTGLHFPLENFHPLRYNLLYESPSTTPRAL